MRRGLSATPIGSRPSNASSLWLDTRNKLPSQARNRLPGAHLALKFSAERAAQHNVSEARLQMRFDAQTHLPQRERDAVQNSG